jgi:endonuclease III
MAQKFTVDPKLLQGSTSNVGPSTVDTTVDDSENESESDDEKPELTPEQKRVLDRKALMELAGVGRKSTDIMMRFVFNEPAIAVDTHVHRIANRLGLARTRAEHQTAEILERDTPDEYRWGAHEWLIAQGKYVCKTRRPECDQCMFTDICDYYQEHTQ